MFVKRGYKFAVVHSRYAVLNVQWILGVGQGKQRSQATLPKYLAMSPEISVEYEESEEGENKEMSHQSLHTKMQHRRPLCITISSPLLHVLHHDVRGSGMRVGATFSAEREEARYVRRSVVGF